MSHTHTEPYIDPELKKFRQRTGGGKLRLTTLDRLPFSRRELLVGLVIAATVAYAPWAFGGMHVSSLVKYNLMALAAMVLLFIPMPTAAEPQIASTRGEENWLRLLHFPIFWLGLLFLGYVLVAGFNPAYKLISPMQGPDWFRVPWYLKELSPIHWLPSSVEAPLEMNPFRYALMYSAPWLLVCALWTGVRSRQMLLLILWVIAISASLNALIGIAQHVTGTDKILFRYGTRGIRGFFATFYLANHAAAFHCLGLGLTGALFLHHLSQARTSKTPWLYAVAAILLITFPIAMVMNSSSRSGIIIMAGMLVLLGLLTLITAIAQRQWLAVGLLGLVVGIVVAAAVLITLPLLESEKFRDDWQTLRYELTDYKNQKRYQLIEATSHMVSQKPVFGWGPGSFRYVFAPEGKDFQGSFPALEFAWYSRVKAPRAFFRYAHCDYIQMLAELGLTGAGLLVLSLALFAARCLKLLGRWRTSWLYLWSGCACVFAFAAFDFPFHNPAVLITLTFTLTWSALMLEVSKDHEVLPQKIPL